MAQPVVLLVGKRPSNLQKFYPKLLERFRFVSPLESPSIPIHAFLKGNAQSIRAMLCECGVGAIPINAQMLDCLPALKCIVNSGVGTDHIDLMECSRRGITVTNAGSAFSPDVADSAVGLLLDVLRSVSASDRFVRSWLWPIKGEFPLARKIRGKRVGIIGLGSIGSEIAKRLEAFGCNIAYNSRKKKDYVPFPYYSTINDLAVNSDILILCCSLTDETYHLINKEVLSLLGKDGIIINVGRGALIDEKELLRCLVQGEIGGAGLDVFENEPDVPKEFFQLDNVVMTPHNAVLTPESFSALHELMVANLEAFFSNKPLLSPVNFE